MPTAFIAIDFINDIVHPSGEISAVAKHVEQRAVLSRVNTALEYARKLDWLVILIKVGFSASYREQPKKSPVFGKANENRILELGQWGTEFHEGLHVDPSDLIIVKPRINPFYGTGLDAALRANDVERLVLSGVSTTWAIESAARDAHDRDYEVVVLEDACAASNDKEHANSLTTLSQLANVTTVNQLMAS